MQVHKYAYKNVMGTKVKMCGLTRAEDVQLACNAGAGFLGFIIEAPSHRSLSVGQASTLSAPYQGKVSRVAVTVNASDRLIKTICKQMQPDFIQFHGDESPSHIKAIAHQYNIRTIKAIAISAPADWEIANTYRHITDIILFDRKAPPYQPRGGHGQVFDWSLLPHANLPEPWVLAGGLTPDNVATALSQTRAPILDVSSGIEQKVGLKDPQKITAFMEAVQYAQTHKPLWT